jgi:hypothetical protein
MTVDPTRDSRVALLALCVCLQACLPNDTRPAPGRLQLSVAADEALLSSITTADGWQITYERFVVSMGEVELEGDDCSSYAESDYLRVLELRGPGPHLLNTNYAFGNCELSFRLQNPGEDAVLGLGVDEATKALLRTPGSDTFVRDRPASLHVEGSALKSGATRRFAWSFRRDLEYTDCGTIALGSDDAQSLEIRMQGATLFQDRPEAADAELVFEPYAAADTDSDGVITLDELAAVPLVEGPFASLGARLYFGLVPSLPTLGEGGSCQARPHDD